MMSAAYQRLTLVAPRELEEALVETLLELTSTGFTAINVAGHGEGFDQAGIRERVRGRVDRLMLWLLLPDGQAERVLAEVEKRLPHSRIVWWLEPVQARGRLA